MSLLCRCLQIEIDEVFQQERLRTAVPVLPLVDRAERDTDFLGELLLSHAQARPEGFYQGRNVRLLCG